jgi:hypothetical protein
VRIIYPNAPEDMRKISGGGEGGNAGLTTLSCVCCHTHKF